jgi:hypothetical protein
MHGVLDFAKAERLGSAVALDYRIDILDPHTSSYTVSE